MPSLLKNLQHEISNRKHSLSNNQDETEEEKFFDASEMLDDDNDVEKSNNNYGAITGQQTIGISKQTTTKTKTTASNKLSKWGRLKHNVESGEFLLNRQSSADEVNRDTTASRLTPSLSAGELFHQLSNISLLECLLVFIMYLLLGVVAYSFVFEHWPILDSVYFSIVSCTTVGYGDITPSNDPSRIFTSCFVLLGVFLIANIALGRLGEAIMESNVVTLNKGDAEYERRALNLFEDDQDNSDNERKATRVTSISFCYMNTTVIILLFVFAGGLVLGAGDGWNLVDSIYFGVSTFTTAGFGDFSPAQPLLKIFAIVYIPFAVCSMGYLLGEASLLLVEKKMEAAQDALLKRRLKVDDLEKMDLNQSGYVDLLNFVEFMLLTMEKVDQDLLDKIHIQFAKLDATKDGKLTKEDLIERRRAKLRNDVGKKLNLHHYKEMLMSKSSKNINNHRQSIFDQKALPLIRSSMLRTTSDD